MFPMPVTTPAETAPPTSSYIPNAAHNPISRKCDFLSISSSMRSRAGNRPSLRCRARPAAPPPSRNVASCCAICSVSARSGDVDSLARLAIRFRNEFIPALAITSHPHQRIPRLVIEMQQPVVLHCFIEKPSPRERARVWFDVVRQIVRGADMINRWHHVRCKDDRAIDIVGKEDRLLSPGVAWDEKDVDAGK